CDESRTLWFSTTSGPKLTETVRSETVVFGDERLEHCVVSSGGQQRPGADEEKRRHRSLAVDCDRSPWLEVELCPRGSRYPFCDLDTAGHTMRLHSTRRVHRVTPYVVAELVSSDHPSDNGAGIDANAQLQRFAVWRP